MGGGCCTQLGVAAVDGRADDAESSVSIVHAHKQRVAAHFGQGWVDDYPITHRDSRDLGARLHHFTGDVHASDVWQPVTGQSELAGALNQVEPVHAAGHDAHDHIRRTHAGIRHVLVPDHLRTAVSAVARGLHIRSFVRSARDYSRLKPSGITGSLPPLTHSTISLPHGSWNAWLKPLNSFQ